ncbi:MAG TPA: 3-hydroxyacyl-CoA dehydrogenase [Devosia sp.]|nr:3-hydroxyacyl-CoA dehydrogenase [Devosia sp.]
MKIACIGVGLIGRSWTVAFTRAGHDVAIWDANPAAVPAAMKAIYQSLKDLRETGADLDPDAVFKRVRPVTEMAEALADVDYVQENGPEKLEVRSALFAQMDKLAPPHAILASSSSFYETSLFAEKVAGRHRCLVAHPVNPPHLIPLVEVSGAPFTDASAVETTYELMASIGQVPVKILREVDGFALNRIQAAVLSECFKLVADGVISPDDVDRTVQYGLAFRWSVIGPLAAIELNAPAGLEDYIVRGSPFFRRYVQSSPTVETWETESTSKVVALAATTTEPDVLREKMEERDIGLAKMRNYVMSKK